MWWNLVSILFVYDLNDSLVPMEGSQEDDFSEETGLDISPEFR
jgi:hypothetical protein